MRIDLVMADRISDGGGKAVRVRILEAGLLQRGHQVLVVQPMERSWWSRASNLLLKMTSFFSRDIATGWGVYISVKRMAHRIRHHLAEHQSAEMVLLDCQDWISAEAALMVRRHYRSNMRIVRTVLSSEGAVREMTVNRRLRESSWVWRLMARRERNCLDCVDAVVFGNHHGRERVFGGRLDSCVTTVHGGCDLPEPSAQAIARVNDVLLGFSGPYPNVSCVATFRPVKGLDLLLHAISLLRKRGFVVRCAIAGDGAEKRKLMDLARSLEITEETLFMGMLSREEVAALLKQTYIYVQPSRDETLGGAIIEAMAAGCPVVAFGVGGIPEVIEHGITGLLSVPEDVADLASKIQMLLEDIPLRGRLAVSGRQAYEEHFTQEKMLSRYEEFYARLCEQSEGV